MMSRRTTPNTKFQIQRARAAFTAMSLLVVAAGCEYDPSSVGDIGGLESLGSCAGTTATLGFGYNGAVDPPGGTFHTGTSGDDVIVIANGPVTVDAGGGDDLICIGAVADHGTSSPITIVGGPGNDTIIGSSRTVEACFAESITGCDTGSTSAPPTSSGPLSAPHPTMENLSLLWNTVGDANGNSTVTVRYREFGSGTWLTALPLRNVPGGSNEGFSWSSRHAGSIFGLRPGTSYVVEAQLVDPDGPNDVRTITATTRAVPAAMPGAPIRAATPSSLSSVLGTAQPGDVIELGSGSYSGFSINRSGTPGRPIVVRGLPGAAVNGEIGVFGRSDIHIENLTVNGRIRFNGSDNMSITGNTVNAAAGLGGHGIITFTRAEDSYIADNTINGLTVWQESSLGASGDNIGEGILVAGPGHVIEHNRVRAMRDGISFAEDSGAVDQFSIDVLRNDISEAGDDGVEADFCSHNCRVIDNRLTNTFVAFSAQPSLGGPTYFVRNTAFNVGHVAFKLYRGSQGDVLLHNTVVKGGDAFGIYAGRTVSELYMRNNLLIGGPGDSFNGFSNGSGRVFAVADLDAGSADVDFDGLGSTTGAFSGRFGSVQFNSFAQFRANTTENNATQVTLDVFAAPPPIPIDATTLFSPRDLRLASSSAAINAGTPLPNINESAAGAPDLGAIERGATPPAYGPR